MLFIIGVVAVLGFHEPTWKALSGNIPVMPSASQGCVFLLDCRSGLWCAGVGLQLLSISINSSTNPGLQLCYCQILDSVYSDLFQLSMNLLLPVFG